MSKTQSEKLIEHYKKAAKTRDKFKTNLPNDLGNEYKSNIGDKDYAEQCMYHLTKYYIRDVFGPGTNVQLREFLDDIIKDQMESFNE